ncbi:MAG: SUMF1/EgtB/PvdO family nonheme iron enzyme, partial [Anaerolineae bacterium]|nr:SUMF1/EgtB/PvdO family nonheme iron enzyme [Anaerolineae bacterium]
QDMAGNVWEWVADWYGSYPDAPQVNPTGPDSGTYHVLRGGSWGNGVLNMSTVYRLYQTVDYANLDIGFRCALALETLPITLPMPSPTTQPSATSPSSPTSAPALPPTWTPAAAESPSAQEEA